jgi:hypothetical protein
MHSSRSRPHSHPLSYLPTVPVYKWTDHLITQFTSVRVPLFHRESRRTRFLLSDVFIPFLIWSTEYLKQKYMRDFECEFEFESDDKSHESHELDRESVLECRCVDVRRKSAKTHVPVHRVDINVDGEKKNDPRGNDMNDCYTRIRAYTQSQTRSNLAPPLLLSFPRVCVLCFFFVLFLVHQLIRAQVLFASAVRMSHLKSLMNRHRTMKLRESIINDGARIRKTA